MRHVAGSSGRSVEELTTSVPSLPVAFAPLGLKYLEEHELRRRFDSYDTDGDGVINAHEARAMLRDAGAEGSLAEAEQAVAAFGVAGGAQGAISWEELKRAVDVAATPVDGRVRPIYATLTLLFTSQGTQFPVLPQLARSLELSAADVGLLTACTALARLACNVPAALFAERVGRRPLLIAGPAVSAVGMCVLASSSSFAQLAAGNACSSNPHPNPHPNPSPNPDPDPDPKSQALSLGVLQYPSPQATRASARAWRARWRGRASTCPTSPRRATARRPQRPCCRARSWASPSAPRSAE